MSMIKNMIQDFIDHCKELYEEQGATSVIHYVNKEMYLKVHPVVDLIKYHHCPQCEAEMPVLQESCLVCGSTVKQLVYGDTLTTLGNVRELIADLDDKDLVYVEACDEHGDVKDLYPMSIDVIENIELKDGSIVREVRFCQRPNSEPDTRDKQPVIDAVLKQVRIDIYYGDESILEELLKLLPIEILINSLPYEKMKAMYEHYNKEIKLPTGLKDKNNKDIHEGQSL